MTQRHRGGDSEGNSSGSLEHSDQGPDKANEEKLVVVVRLRPLRADEGERILHCVDSKTVVLEEADVDPNDVLRQRRGGERQYIFDATFDEDSSQEEVYEATAKGLVRDVLLGYNATVFAYGATGSGKTYTMVGDTNHPGIMVSALNDLFNSIDRHGNQFTVTLSYLEIYNENIRDLLNPSSGYLELREDMSRGRNIHVAGLTQVQAKSTQEVMSLLQRGNQERSVEPTAANQTSSRSHALLSVVVKRSSAIRHQDRLKTRTRHGKLFMLDLAGSERASQTKNRGKRLVEGAHINRSLLALGNCINALSGAAPGARYVNYRDSKLTRLLREALSGNCRTVMIAHVAPSAHHREETRNTLVYAARATGISHKVERNVFDVTFHVSQYRNIISDLRSEIARLRSKMEEERPLSGDGVSHHGGHVKQLREQIVATFRDQMKLRRRLMDIDGHLLSLGVEAERQHQIISQWESSSSRLYKRKGERLRRDSSNGHDDWSDDLNVHQAWSELSYIEREQERYVALRSATIHELDQCRQRATNVENELPSLLDSEAEREMLSLLCRVHELEADKMALQGERLVQTHELRRRGELLKRFSRQQHITDDIITRQRQLMEETHVKMPPDLQDLYTLYQREIHATTFSADATSFEHSLPPVSSNQNGNRMSGPQLFERSPRMPTAFLIRHNELDMPLRTPTSSSTASSEWDSVLPKLARTPPNQKASRPPPPPPVLFPPIMKQSTKH